MVLCRPFLRTSALSSPFAGTGGSAGLRTHKEEGPETWHRQQGRTPGPSWGHPAAPLVLPSSSFRWPGLQQLQAVGVCAGGSCFSPRSLTRCALEQDRVKPVRGESGAGFRGHHPAYYRKGPELGWATERRGTWKLSGWRKYTGMLSLLLFLPRTEGLGEPSMGPSLWRQGKCESRDHEWLRAVVEPREQACMREALARIAWALPPRAAHVPGGCRG